MNNFRDYLASLMEVAKLTIHSQRAEIAELMQKTQQLERKNVELRFLADGHEETIERLERENAALRNNLAGLENQSQWQCSCGGTDCEGMKENDALRAEIEEAQCVVIGTRLEARELKHENDELWERLGRAAVDEGKLRRENTRLLEAVLNARKEAKP